MNNDEEQHKLFCGIVATLYLWRASESLDGYGHMDHARNARDEYLAKVEAFEAMKKAASESA